MVVNEISVAANPADSLDQIAEAAPSRRPGERLEVSRGDDRLRKLAARGNSDWLTIKEGTRTLLGPSELIVRRRARDTEHQLASSHQRDLRREERAVAHE